MLEANKNAINLKVVKEEITQRELQNRFGQKNKSIQDVGDTGFLSVLAVTTPEKLSPEQWYGISEYLITNYGITGMEALFEIDMPEPEPCCQNNLYVTAHMRQDESPESMEPEITTERPSVERPLPR